MKSPQIKLKKVAQGHSYCGPASLVSLLDFYGIKLSQKKLVAMTYADRDDGTDHRDIIEALKKLHFKVHVKRNGTWEDLRALTEKGTPVLVGWFSTYGWPDDHFSVVYKVTDKYIWMMDPEIADYRKITRPIFEHLWWDLDTPRNLKVDGWYLWIEPKKNSGQKSKNK